MGRTYNRDARDNSEREFARYLKRIFEEEAERSISQEQIDRVLAPVFERIEAGEFCSSRDDEAPPDEALQHQAAQNQAPAVITRVLISAETITALHKIAAKRKEHKGKTGGGRLP